MCLIYNVNIFLAGKGGQVRKSGPGTHTISLGDYHKGTKVQIIDIESEWYEIKTADGHIGWIQKQDVEVI